VALGLTVAAAWGSRCFLDVGAGDGLGVASGLAVGTASASCPRLSFAGVAEGVGEALGAAFAGAPQCHHPSFFGVADGTGLAEGVAAAA